MSGQRAAVTGTIAESVSAAASRDEQRHLVPPAPPDDREKYSYLVRNLVYLTTVILIGSVCLVISQLRFELHDLVLSPFLLFTGLYIVYQAISLPVNFAGRGFDLAAHQARIEAWRPAAYPAVDVYLPICGEPIGLLRNTWTSVAGLVGNYPGEAQVYVLDDGPSEEARLMAGSFGYNYIHRDDWPAGKKAGNLRYAFARTSAEYLAIFDADFAPRHDFLAETLPYMDDPKIAIVQTPQYFRSSPAQTWIERAAGPALGVLGQAWLGYQGRTTGGFSSVLWYITLSLIFVPPTALIMSGRITDRAKIWFALYMALALLATRFVLYPQEFAYHDELIHYRVLLSIEQTKHLFTPNSLLPDTADYPGMEIATAAVHQLTGLSLHAAGLVLLCAVRVVMTLALIRIIQMVTGSTTAGCLAAVIYATNPQYIFFNSQFSYQSVALPLCFFCVFVIALSRNTRSPLSVVPGTAIILAVAATHHPMPWGLGIWVLMRGSRFW